MDLFLVGLDSQFMSGKFVQFYGLRRGVQFYLSDVDQGHRVAADQEGIGEGHVGLSQDAYRNVLDDCRI